MSTHFCYDTNIVTVKLTLEGKFPGWDYLDVKVTVPFSVNRFDEIHYDFDNFEIERVTSPSVQGGSVDISLQLGKHLEELYVLVRESIESESEDWREY